MLRIAAVALGSNLSSAWGERRATLDEAVRRVGTFGIVLRVSSCYETAPVGYVDQPDFLNGALLLATELEPVALLRELLSVEQAMGRERLVAKGPRVIDLDLLLMEDVVIKTAELVLPHPAMAKRRFVLEPLAEIAGEMREPVSGRTVREMLAELTASGADRNTP